MIRRSHFRSVLLLSCVLSMGFPLAGAGADEAPTVFDPSLFEALEWRNIGPYRGGRSTAATGVVSDPFTYYMGTTGGGLWRTTDAGGRWENISDDHFETGSVGAVAVAPSDPNVIWVGMGEACIRGVMTTHGDGVYRSTDRGRSFAHVGLAESRHIAKVIVHPGDPDTAWVAAQGHAWGPSEERGVYKTTDGGATWRRTLFVDSTTGPSDLAIDATNPRVLYAAMWHHRRYPWKIESGGHGSGIWKSVDGGDSWERLEDGLPETMGKIGVAVSPADPSRVFAIVEAEEGGLYRSDDSGKSWKRINEDRVLQTRSWYYMHVFAHPKNADVVWVLNAPAMKSIDGGKSFSRVRTPHGDNHDLWIHPDKPRFMINANDGGANVSLNGGKTWSTQANQPTAQFYRVAVDNAVPYRVYGGQQDNSAVRIASRSPESRIGARHWESIAGCESADPAFDPDDTRYVYGGCYQGILSEWDAVTKRQRSVMAYPYLGLSVAPKETRYRFNWNAPLLASRHNPKRLWHGGNVVLETIDRGVTWREISPDLTRDEETRQDHGGGPITSEGAGGEVYNTILALADSPHEDGVLWAGSDDGLVHLTRNGGVDWADVTPRGVGEAMINAIEVSPHDPATVYLAVTRYKYGDLSPLIFETRDYGGSWRQRAGDLPADTIVRVVREDPERRGLLYAGTETGVFVSWDGGGRWQRLEEGLPRVPVTDLEVHRGDLVAATQGRAFWILDDLTPLREMNRDTAESRLRLFTPATAMLDFGGSGRPDGLAGANPPAGLRLRYLIGAEEAEAEAEEGKADEVEETPLVIEIFDAEGRFVRRAASDEKASGGEGFGGPPRKPPPTEPGLNEWVWELTWHEGAKVEGLSVFGPRAPGVGPGTYRVRLSRGDLVEEREAEVRLHPESDLTAADYEPQQALLVELRDLLHELYDSANRLQAVKTQVEDRVERTAELDAGEAIGEAGKALVEQIDALDDRLLQRGHSNFQDIINHPARLNGELAFLLGDVESGPPLTAGARERFTELEGRFAALRSELAELFAGPLGTFNALFEEHGVPAIVVPDIEPSDPEASAL